MVAAGSPGPSVAALVARVLVRGWREVLPFAAAMWLGEAIWLTLAAFGLAALAESLHWAFLLVKYLGAAYLLYLSPRHVYPMLEGYAQRLIGFVQARRIGRDLGSRLS